MTCPIVCDGARRMLAAALDAEVAAYINAHAGQVGDTHLTTGNVQVTTATWQRALDILEDLGHPDAVALRIRLLETRDTQRAGG